MRSYDDGNFSKEQKPTCFTGVCSRIRRFVFGAMFTVLLQTAATAVHAGDYWCYLIAQRDFSDNVGRAGVGLDTTFHQGPLWLGLTGEVGGAATNSPGLDYRMEVSAGYQVRNKLFSIAPFAGYGYRQWAAEPPQDSEIRTDYIPIGLAGDVHLSSSFSLFSKAGARYHINQEHWVPFVEAGIQVASAKTSLFYEKLRLDQSRNGDIAGIKFGLAF